MKQGAPTIKVTGMVPTTLLRAAERHTEAIEEIWSERPDGYWILLRDGWWHRGDMTTAIHEYTVRGAIAAMRDIQSDPRPRNQR